MAEMIMILIAVAVYLLWKIAHQKRYISAASTDWIILERHALVHSSSGPRWAEGEPLNLTFLPVLGWEVDHGAMMPVTHRRYRVAEQLNANTMDRETKYETRGYVLRDGVVFDIDDMSHSDLWDRIYSYAFAGCEVKVNGGPVPDSCSAKFSEAFEICTRERARAQVSQSPHAPPSPF